MVAGALAARGAVVVATLAVAVLAAPAGARAHGAPFDVLVFSRAQLYHHESIADGQRMLAELGAQHGFSVTTTEEQDAFTDAGLAPYEAVVFLSTNREVLDPPAQDALERYVRGGGGWAGVHGASDTEYGWPFFGELLAGAWFRSHPPIQPATVVGEDRGHPSTADLPPRWTRSDEWYAFTASPRPGARVLLRVDETSYAPADSAMGADHPIAWCRTVGAGRAWYTAMGHTPSSYAEPLFRAHVLGGVLAAAGDRPSDCAPRALARPTLTVRRRVGRSTLRRRGLNVRVRCGYACSASVVLRTRARRLTRTASVTLGAGDARTVRLRLRRRLGRARRASIIATLRPPGAGAPERLERVVAVR